MRVSEQEREREPKKEDIERKLINFKFLSLLHLLISVFSPRFQIMNEEGNRKSPERLALSTLELLESYWLKRLLIEKVGRRVKRKENQSCKDIWGGWLGRVRSEWRYDCSVAQNTLSTETG